MNAKRGIIVLGLLSAASMPTWAQQIKGVVIDQKSKETLIGAVVTVDGTNVKAITNIDGNFLIDGLKKDKTYTLYINYVGYKTQKIDGVQAKDADQVIALQPDEQQLKEVTVTAVERRNTDAAMIQVAKSSPVIVSNVSAQEISRTQDTNAGEVIRRVPGVSLIDDKFVMVRGLSQRYNNVWVNGGAVPSSEADSRAFSFDIIPSSQIDNLTIVKSPTAEYPADYSGGFIIVNTKEIPAENSFNIAVGGNWNTSSAFKDFSYSKGSGTDFLGFDNGLRILKNGVRMLRPGGKLLYSTCTFAPVENEGSISWILEQCPEMELIPIEGYEGFSEGNPAWGDGREELRRCVRIWPHKMKGEGHFLALLKKSEDAPETRIRLEPPTRMDKKNKAVLEEFFRDCQWKPDWERVQIKGEKVYLVPELPAKLNGIHFLRNGLYLGDLKKNRFEPSQQLAMTLKASDYEGSVSLSPEDERIGRYLRGETLLLEPGEATREKGWILVCVDQYALGWGKLVNGVLKNKYWSGWRLKS